MAQSRVVATVVRRHRDGAAQVTPDELVVEEALAIRLDGHLVATTMRTPGHDIELAAGFCFAEGHIGRGDIRAVKYCDGPCGPGETTYNEINVDTEGRAGPPESVRVGTTTSSCGACGATDIEALVARLPRLVAPTVVPGADLVDAVVAAAAQAAPLFARTGAVHGAAAFDLSSAAIEVAREDIGRHNAVDKVVGRLLFDGRLPATRLGLYVSGRASFELVQKAWAAGFSVLVAVSGPSSLAVATARAAGLTLIGFARGDGRMNLYSPDPLIALGGHHRAEPVNGAVT